MFQSSSSNLSALVRKQDLPKLLQRLSNSQPNDTKEFVNDCAPLYWAAVGGDDNIVKVLLGAQADVGWTDTSRRTALHVACSGGHDAIIPQLVAAGADVNATNINGNTPLHFAADHGKTACIRQLLIANADLSITNKHNQVALELAEAKSHAAAATLLRQAAAGASGGAAATASGTPFRISLLAGSSKTVGGMMPGAALKHLRFTPRPAGQDWRHAVTTTSLHATCQTLGESGMTHEAPPQGPISFRVYNLADHGVTITWPQCGLRGPNEGYDPESCEHGQRLDSQYPTWARFAQQAYPGTTYTLDALGHKEDYTVGYDSSQTLFVTTNATYVDSQPLPRGADASAPAPPLPRNPLLEKAVRADDVPKVKALLSEHGQSLLGDRNEYGANIIYFAASLGKAASLRVLLAAGGSVESTDAYSRSALHVACSGGHDAIIPQLVDAGADVNATNINGNTPLHFAADHGKTTCIRQLLTANADLSITNKHNQVALELAEAKSHAAAATLLRQAASQAEVTSTPRNPQLEAAVRADDVSKIEALLAQHGPGLLEGVNMHGGNIMHFAASLGKAASLRVMLAAGGSIGPGQHANGWTPLFLAKRDGRLDCVELLEVAAAQGQPEPEPDQGIVPGNIPEGAANLEAAAAALSNERDQLQQRQPQLKEQHRLAQQELQHQHQEQLQALQRQQREQIQALQVDQQKQAQELQQQLDDVERKEREVAERRLWEAEMRQMVSQFSDACATDEVTARGCLDKAGWDLEVATADYLARQQEARKKMVDTFMQERFADEATARRCLEQTGWKLTRAVQLYMPPVPESPMAGRSFAKSNFKVEYVKATVPKAQMQFGNSLGKLLEGYCRKHGIPFEEDEGEHYLDSLVAEAMTSPGDPIAVMAQRMWTSSLRLRGKEFCYILNDAARDDEELARPVAKVSRAINMLCVTADRPTAAVHPPDHVCYRGAGFDDAFRSFFVAGRAFRQPAYLATSFSREVAMGFLRRSPMAAKVLWLVHIDPVHKCVHVNLVQKSNVPGEEEYLFAPYSAFTVRSAKWAAGTNADPHVIEIQAAPDNKAAREDLDLAPWS